ncbi:MAG: S-adenosylmethionine decarboxylase [Alphaproteobacteria bacterium]|nr:S-adenosylmethionine decarboxylase [Alphaproteobacteria bacterium]
MTLGLHWLGEARGCEPAALVEPARIAAFLEGLAVDLGLTLMDAPRVHAVKGGMAGVVLLGESHASIHTVPERAVALVDVFSCTTLDPLRAEAFVRRELGASDVRWRLVER